MQRATAGAARAHAAILTRAAGTAQVVGFGDRAIHVATDVLGRRAAHAAVTAAAASGTAPRRPHTATRPSASSTLAHVPLAIAADSSTRLDRHVIGLQHKRSVIGVVG